MSQSIISQVSQNNGSICKCLTNSICSRLGNILGKILFCECFQGIQTVFPHHQIEIPNQAKHIEGKKTLIIDLDETLVHSSFTYISDFDFTLKIRVRKTNYSIYVRVRPGCEEFLKKMSEYYEIFIFTASLPEYANPVIDKIDPQRVCQLRLFRQNCSIVNGVFVKDLSRVGRNLGNVIIIDNSKSSFSLQPNNAIHIKNYFDDPSDSELIDLMPFLRLVSTFDDVRPIEENLKKYNKYECIYFSSNGVGKIFDRKDNTIIEDVDSVNQTIDSSKDETSLLNSHTKKGQIKLQTNFSLDEEEYNAEQQFRDQQGLNSPNLNNHQQDA